MENNQNKVTNNKKVDKCKCKDTKKDFGLSRYTYADYVVLSSTLAYAISEELNDEDLAFFIVFLSQVSSDLALLRTKRASANVQQAKSTENEQEEEVIEAVDIGAIDDTLATTISRDKKRIKRKKIKRKRKT